MESTPRHPSEVSPSLVLLEMELFPWIFVKKMKKMVKEKGGRDTRVAEEERRRR